MYLRKVLILLTVFILGFCIQSKAQLTITSASGITPQQLVQNILVGTGVTISNVTFNGSSGNITGDMIGSFTTGSTPTNMGFPTGVILSSGGVTGAMGPNNSGSTTTATSMSTQLLDPQLQALVPLKTVIESSVLEFDFVPLADTIKFRYVFGSEEYPEWVNDLYNDVFGFFISGANPMGPNYVNKNIALIPNTSLPVCIDNVNVNTNSQYFITNPTGGSIQYDGFTTILTAWALVIPCTSYHMKLAIADCGDPSYDSGVFLEANSFSSPHVSIQKTTSNPSASAQNAIEGCSNMFLTFKYPFKPNPPLPISIVLIGGTATYGSDYSLSILYPITNILYIPTTADSVRLTITPIFDHISEGTETVTIVFQTANCGHMYDTVTFNIQDYDSLTAVAYGDTTLCNNQTPISVIANGGVLPYQYLWSNGAGTAANFTPTFTSDTTFKITVKDACLKNATDSVKIVLDCDFARAGPDDTICYGQTTTLHASIDTNNHHIVGTPIYSWSNGESTPTIIVSPTDTTTYIVTITDVFSDKDSVTVFVNPLPIVTATSDLSTICSNGSTTLHATGALTYLWSSNITDLSLNGQKTLANPIISPNSSTIYTVIGSNADSCSNTTTVNVNVSPQPNIQILAFPNPVSVFEPTVHIYDASGENNSFLWLLGDGTSSTLNNFYHTYSDQDTGRYLINVIATNAFGCFDSANLVVIVRPDETFYVPNTFTPNNDGLNDVFKVYGMGVLTFEMYIYDRWGKTVYKSLYMNEGWDGKVDNELAPDGIYAYTIIYKDNIGIKHSKSGAITIIR